MCSAITTFFSTGNDALVDVTGAVENDLSGQGQFHFGALKKGVGANLKDVTKDGIQPDGIDEGVIFGGIFEEDSTGNCVSLSAKAPVGATRGKIARKW